MYSSVKFLSPITTAGLPAPGPLPAGAAPPVVDEVAGVLAVELADEVELVLELDELPHAASVSITAIAGITVLIVFMVPPGSLKWVPTCVRAGSSL
jgi:hypothetical protein